MRAISALALVGTLGFLSACETAAPYSNIIDTTGRGVGFSDYAQYLRAQEELSRIRRAQAAQAQAMPRTQVASAPQSAQSSTIGQEAVASVRSASPSALPPGPGMQSAPVTQQVLPPAASSQATAPLAAPNQTAPSQTSQASAPQATPAPAATAPSSAAVSEQGFTPQSFGTVQQNTLVERDFVPQVRVSEAELAQGAGGPNLFVYALSTQHNVGDTRYNRNHPLRWRRWETACAQFPSQDLAQEAFLAAGGPENDPNNLDPDGDGFACWWDPAPFRQAARTARARE